MLVLPFGVSALTLQPIPEGMDVVVSIANHSDLPLQDLVTNNPMVPPPARDMFENFLKAVSFNPLTDITALQFLGAIEKKQMVVVASGKFDTEKIMAQIKLVGEQKFEPAQGGGQTAQMLPSRDMDQACRPRGGGQVLRHAGIFGLEPGHLFAAEGLAGPPVAAGTGPLPGHLLGENGYLGGGQDVEIFRVEQVVFEQGQPAPRGLTVPEGFDRKSRPFGVREGRRPFIRQGQLGFHRLQARRQRAIGAPEGLEPRP